VFLLDTNVVSELRKVRAGRANPHVAAWAKSVPSSALYLSVISVMELEIGIGAVARRDPAQHAVLRTWMDNFVMPAFAGRILDVSLPVALRCAALHQPQPRSERDALIAATALHHQLKVVTRNEADFTGMVGLINPWTPTA
jgi:toxin FitB